MTRTFITVNNEDRFNAIKNYFNENDNVELEEFVDGDRHQLTVSCDSSDKMTARLISQVENLYKNYEDVEIW